MNKERRLLDECSQFLTSVRPEETPAELVKPFPESTLHESTIDELRAKLYEARSFQHTYPQFSEEEAKHFQFVDEATAILEYKNLAEQNKGTPRTYVTKAVGDWNIQGMEQGPTKTSTVAFGDKDGELTKRANVARTKASKRFSGILKATRKMTTEETEQLDELSVSTLKSYKEKASDAVGSYKYGSKAPTMDIGTVHKRVNGFVKAGSKLSDRIKNAKTLIKTNEEVEQIDEAFKEGDEVHYTSAKNFKRTHTSGVVTRIDGDHATVKPHDKIDSEIVHILKLKKVKPAALKTENLEEARGPLKGHPYHTKSDEELNFIVKDAGEAAQAMKGHSPKSEAKYIDQVNDASTVLHYRKNGGARVVKESEELDEGNGSTVRAHAFTNVATSKKIIKDAQSALDAGGDTMWPGPKAGFKRLISVHQKHIENAQKSSVTEGYMKTIKRHFQGWGDTAEKPKDIKARVSSMSDAALANSRNTKTKMDPEPHTPEATQRKLIDREFEKRKTNEEISPDIASAKQRPYKTHKQPPIGPIPEKFKKKNLPESFDRTGSLNRIKNLLG